jgi:hypothetical protein
MLKYAHANMGDGPSTLNKEILLTHKITFHVNGNGIGLGWAVYKTHHRDVFAHNGETGGFQSFLIIDPKGVAYGVTYFLRVATAILESAVP